MWRHLWEATVYVSKKVFFVFGVLWLLLVAVSEWAKGFSDVRSASSFLFPKLAVFAVGMLITPFPLWAVLALSFLPVPAVGTIYILSILVVLKQ